MPQTPCLRDDSQKFFGRERPQLLLRLFREAMLFHVLLQLLQLGATRFRVFPVLLQLLQVGATRFRGSELNI